jgi:phosphonate transport system substrate-binding protein
MISMSRRRLTGRAATAAVAALLPASLHANPKRLIFGVGLFQPDRERNDATYRPLAAHLSRRLGRAVDLRTVDTWEGLAKSLATGETDIALMGPWGFVLANHHADAQAVATILSEGRPEDFAMIVTHPDSGLNTIEDLLGARGRGRSFAFGDPGSTSGFLVPMHFFMQRGIDPARHFGRVLYTRHQAIQTQVTAGQIDAGADFNRNRDEMIRQGLIRAERSRILWQSPPLPNDAVAVSASLAKDAGFVRTLQAALADVGGLLKSEPGLLPVPYTGFVVSDNARYTPIREAGLATGRLKPR